MFFKLPIILSVLLVNAMEILSFFLVYMAECNVRNRNKLMTGAECFRKKLITCVKLQKKISSGNKVLE